jgi:hypothetical protein
VPTNRALFDAELVAVTRIRGVVDDGVDVRTTLGTSIPAVTVELAGGGPIREGILAEPRVSLNAWAPSRAAALALIGQAVGALITVEGDTAGWQAEGVQIYRGRTALAPVYSFDPVAQKPRYTATVALTGRTTL